MYNFLSTFAACAIAKACIGFVAKLLPIILKLLMFLLIAGGIWKSDGACSEKFELFVFGFVSKFENLVCLKK